MSTSRLLGVMAVLSTAIVTPVIAAGDFRTRLLRVFLSQCELHE